MALHLNDRARSDLVSALDFEAPPEELERALINGIDNGPREPEFRNADSIFSIVHNCTADGAAKETLFVAYGDIFVRLKVSTPDYCDDNFDASIWGDIFPIAELKQRIDEEKQIYVRDRVNEIERTLGDYGLELLNSCVKNRINHRHRGKR